MFKNRWYIVILIMLFLLSVAGFFLVKVLSPRMSEQTVAIIPNDVAMVFTIDCPQIMMESDFSSIRKSSSYLSYIRKASLENPIFAEIIRDPINSGIAVNGDVFFAYDKDTSGRGEDFSALIVPLRNSDAFEEIVKTRKRSSKTILREGSYSYYEVDQLTAIAWNEQNVIFGSSNAFMSLVGKMERFFSTQPSRSVISDAEFRKVMDSDADIAFWISTSAYVNDKAVLEKFALSNFPRDILSGNYITGSVNFGKGDIEGSAQFTFRDELRGGFDNFFREESMSEVLDYLPATDLSLLLSTSLNLPKIFHRGLDDPQLKLKIDEILGKRDMSVEDLFRIFTGNVTLATYSDPASETPTLALVMEIDNPDKFNKLIRVGLSEGILIKEGEDIYRLYAEGGSVNSGGTAVSFPDGMIRAMIKGDHLFLVSSERIFNGLIAGKVPPQERIDPLITEQFRSSFIAGYSDLTALPGTGGRQKLDMRSVAFRLDNRELRFRLDLSDPDQYALKDIFFSVN